MRVLHLPTAVGGGPSGLSYQLKLIDIESEVWSIEQNYLNYPVDRVLTKPQDALVVQMLKALRAGSYVFGRWDVVHFNYGSTLFSNGGRLLALRPNAVASTVAAKLITSALSTVALILQRLELGVLRMRGIPIFVTYQGDDARQGDYCREHFEISIATQVPPGFFTQQSDEFKRRQIALMDKYSAKLYAVNPDLMNVLPETAKFVPYGHVPVADWLPVYVTPDRQKLRFAHAPSNRSVKGTDYILAAFADLEAEGYQFELDLIEGVSNEVALARYRDADILVDQLFAGWYGGVAVEAMALGKPVVVYLRDSDLRFLPPGMEEELPFLRATPMTIKEALRDIIDMPRDELVAVAKRSRTFVERWHDPSRIALEIANDYREARRSKRKSGEA